MGKKLFSLMLCLCASIGITFAQNMTVTGTDRHRYGHFC